MVKEFKLDDINPLAALKNNLWQAMNLLRGFIDVNEYHFILFLLTLQRKGVLKDFVFNEPDNFMKQIELAIDIDKLDADTKEELINILRIYEHAIKNVNANVIYELIGFLKSLDQLVLDEHFAEIFDELLYKLSKWQGRVTGEFMLPMELSRFVCALAELPQQAKVYNPFAGVASFGVFLDHHQQYIGQELDYTTWAIGKLRLMAYDREYSSTLLLGDSIKDWNPIRIYKSNKLEDILLHGSVKEKYDLVIANPPYGVKLPLHTSGKFGAIRSCEHFFIENGLEGLKPDGKLIAVISPGFLFHGGRTERNMRRYLIENDLLEMIISLPAGLLTKTGIPVSILLINKQKKEKGYVRFIDAKNFVDTKSPREKIFKDYALNSFIKTGKESDFTRIVSNETILKLDFNLNVPRYFQKKYDGVSLGELGSFIKGQRILEEQKGKFIRIRELKDDTVNFQLSLNEIEDVEIPRQAQKIAESCLLLASRWKTLKPTYFNYTGTPVFISPDMLAFKVDEAKCDIVYLINELHSGYIKEQLDAFRTGSFIPIIRKEDLLSIIISLPNLNDQFLEIQKSLESQKLIVNQRLVALADEKKRELNLFTKIHGLEAEIVEQNTYLRHTLAGPSSNLKDSVSNIKKIFLEKILPAYPELVNLKISDKHLVTLGEYLTIIERDAAKIVAAVTSQLKVDTGIDTKSLTPVEIIDFLEKYSIEYNERAGLNFKIEFDIDKEVFIDTNGERIKAYISANDDLLRELFDNLIDNAVKHAFLPGANNRIEIFLMKNTENEDQDEVSILCSNTGKPFPEDFTINNFIRKGAKFGPNAGDGFGGWYINEVVKKLNGVFDIIDETGTEGLPGTDLATSFELNFPIIETEENV